MNTAFKPSVRLLALFLAVLTVAYLLPTTVFGEITKEFKNCSKINMISGGVK